MLIKHLSDALEVAWPALYVTSRSGSSSRLYKTGPSSGGSGTWRRMRLRNDIGCSVPWAIAQTVRGGCDTRSCCGSVNR